MSRRLLRRMRRLATAAADRLPPPRDRAARQLLHSARDLIEGRHATKGKRRSRSTDPQSPTIVSAPPAKPLAATVWATPGSYNSPIVDVTEVRGQGSDANTRVLIQGIDLDIELHDTIWDEWRPHAAKWDQAIDGRQRRYHADNRMFGPHSARMLAAAIGAIGPRRYFEIGSGFSSAVILDLNDCERVNDPIACTFIEPYPTRLNEIMRSTDHEHCRVHVTKLQDVDIHIFDQLESGDVLFIDSSHVAKSGSDVLMEIFDILPRLASGVFVHFHDIFYPFDYPLKWMVQQNRSWNEAYFLRAFLMYNSEFAVHFWTDFHALFGSHADDPLVGRASSIWIRRT